MWANILKFGTMYSLLNTHHVRACPPRGPKTPQNSENDHIRVFALLTRHEAVFLPLWHTLLAPSSGGSPYLPACYVFIQLNNNQT